MAKKKKLIAAVQLQSVGSTLDDLDVWARRMAQWCTDMYDWGMRVHDHWPPKAVREYIPKPPPPPPYPPN